MTTIPDSFYGVREEKYDDRDYLVGGEVIIPKPEFTFEDHKIQYNQNVVAKNSCTIHGAMTALSAQTGVTFELDPRKFLWEKAKERGASDDWGWYVQSAMQLIREYWNGDLGGEKTKNQVTYRRVNMLEQWDYFVEILNKGYSFSTAYRGNANYNKDAFFEGDCMLDRTENVGDTTYGHCITITKIGDNICVIDNYEGVRTCNIYRLADLKELVKNRVFFEQAYFFITENSYHTHNEVSEWAKEAVQKCKDKGIATHWDSPQEIVGTKDARLMMYRAGVFTVDTKRELTKEELAVFLDRNNLL